MVEFKDLVIEYSGSLQMITNLNIEKNINDHSRIKINGIIPNSEGHKKIIEASITDKIKIYLKENSEKIIFYGLIDDIELEESADFFCCQY